MQVLFDHNGCIRRFNAPEEILKEFYEVRLDMYKKRKAYLDGMLSAESLKLDNIARFILEKIEGTIVIGEFVHRGRPVFAVVIIVVSLLL